MSSQIFPENPAARRLTSIPGTGTKIEQHTNSRIATPRDYFIGATVAAVLIGGYAEHTPMLNAISDTSKSVVSGVEGTAGAVQSLLTPDGQPKGLSVKDLQNSKYKITITPTPEMAAKGASELGELTDPGVYQGPHSNATTAASLNAEIAEQHGGILSNGQEVIRPGEAYQVPSIPEGLPK